MNKIVSGILALSLLILLALPIGATTHNSTTDKTVTQDIEFYHNIGNTINTDGGSQDVEIYHEVSGRYTLTIPESIALSKSGATVSTVSLSEVNLGGGSVSISLSSKNYSGGWRLISKADTLNYSIKIDGSELANGGTVLSCPDGTQLASKQISFSLTDATPTTVSYTDRLTFTVSVNG